MNYDVIVIGGSYAGMAAALQLLRARRSVLIVDAGKRRNRTATHSHGFLGQDGVDPAALARMARMQVMAYPTLTWVDGEAERVTGAKDAFQVECSGQSYMGRRILFATGVLDRLPEIPGLQERWGRRVFHCPYCHGYELNQGTIGVIATGPMSIHQAQLVAEWGNTTFFANAALEIEQASADELASRGIRVEPTSIRAIEGDAEVVLVDGRRQAFAGLFTAPRNAPATPVAEQLGCEMAETPFGTQIWTSDNKETSVPGAFACGDVARMPHSLSLAVADGAWAGAQLHRSLVWPNA
jgi:thioredoxin reductase